MGDRKGTVLSQLRRLRLWISFPAAQFGEDFPRYRSSPNIASNASVINFVYWVRASIPHLQKV